MDAITRTDPMVRPDVQAFLALLAAMQQKPMNELPLDEARAAYKAMTPVGDAEPTPLAIVRDLACPGPAGEIPLRYYDARETREPGPAMVFFHGGGFVIGDRDTHHPLCTYMAKELDIPIVSVDYRLAPEHAWPAAPDDCEAAARWLAESPEALGLKITGLVTCGDSAGGNLTLVTSNALRDAPAAVPVIAQFPIYPVVDAEHDKYPSFSAFGEGFLLTAEGMKWFDDAYRSPRQDPRADPLYDELAGSPPTLLVTAGLDPLRDEGREYAAKLIRSGVETVYVDFPGTIHGFTCIRKGIPSAQADVAKMIGHMKAMLAGL